MSTTMKDDGGPAFPQLLWSEVKGYDRDGNPDNKTIDHTSSDGATLRDLFAMKALAGILAGNHPITEEADCESMCAKVAYIFADAMLAARNSP
jgi:hypothetical protein